MEKVIKQSAKLMTRLVWPCAACGMKLIISGFKKIPASIYPVILGSLSLIAISPNIKPIITIIPTTKTPT